MLFLGNVAAWKSTSLFLVGSHLIQESGVFMRGALQLPLTSLPSALLVVVTNEVTFSKRFYDKTSLRACRGALPMKHTTRFLGADKRSFGLCDTLVDSRDSTVLVKAISLCVVIDKHQRRRVDDVSRLMPQRYKHLMPYKPPATSPHLPVTCVYSHCFTVAPSDIDHNQHTSAHSYLRMMFDCAALASMRGLLTYFSGDICKYRVQTIRSNYRRESRTGDTIQVEVYQDSSQPLMLGFNVTRDVTETLVQSTVLFYVDGVSKL